MYKEGEENMVEYERYVRNRSLFCFFQTRSAGTVIDDKKESKIGWCIVADSNVLYSCDIYVRTVEMQDASCSNNNNKKIKRIYG